MKITMARIVTALLSAFLFGAFSANAIEIEPTPSSPIKEKVEKIQRSGGALKIEKDPPDDQAMRILDRTIKENIENLPAEKKEHHWGPSLHIGLPHPFNIGLVYLHSSKHFSAEANWGQIDVDYEGTDTNLHNKEINLRYHPTSQAFFIGLGYGQQDIELKKVETVSAQKVQARVKFDSNYWLPHVGWMTNTQDGGFFWALELGWQIPTNGKTRITTNVDLTGNPDYDDLIKDVTDTVDKVGKSSIPNIAVIKFGWLF